MSIEHFSVALSVKIHIVESLLPNTRATRAQLDIEYRTGRAHLKS